LLLSAALATACGDDEGGSLRDDGGAEAGVLAPDGSEPPECEGHADCDDNVYCNGEERCAQGRCMPGEVPDCDDGIACTDDDCSERTRSCRHAPPDLDSDGHFDISCVDRGGTPFGQDCDDQDELRFPGNIEICDEAHHDEDCNPDTNGEKDSDGDGFDDHVCCNFESDQPDAALVCGRDCKDLIANVNPEANEACDGFDNDCDGVEDEGVRVLMFVDRDYDGHGDAAAGAMDESERGTTWSSDHAIMQLPDTIGIL
jgi:hypothetical protein